jgi:bacterioferritin-associated ferredoxin
MLVCHCHGINDRKIKEALLGGARTVGQIARATMAGTCCGGCAPAIREMVESFRPLPVIQNYPAPSLGEGSGLGENAAAAE